MERIIFKDGSIVLETGIRKGSVIVEDGKIAGVDLSGSGPDGAQTLVVDCAGSYVGPGFIDIHVHGGFGRDFLGSDPDGLVEGINYHFENGVTAITPACLSVPFQEINRSIGRIREIKDKTKSTVLGFHVEGVYLDREYRGGHLESYVHAPNPQEYMPLLEKHAGFITEWTLAPELDGALELIKICTQNGITTSVGHSQAEYGVLMRAIDAGLSHSTHFACVMGNLRFERLGKSTGKGFAPGVLETVLLDDRLSTEVIADGCHLHQGLIRLAVKCKGFKKVCVVSDAMMGAGLPDGEYRIGGQDCRVEHNLAVIKNRPEVIASSVTPMIGMFRHLVKNCGIPLHHVWMMCSLTPAKVVGAGRKKGSIRAGKDADLIVMDQNLNIRSIFAKGKMHKIGQSARRLT